MKELLLEPLVFISSFFSSWIEGAHNNVISEKRKNFNIIAIHFIYCILLSLGFGIVLLLYTLVILAIFVGKEISINWLQLSPCVRIVVR